MIFFFFAAVKALIDQEVKNGIPSHRIILGGFSQVSVAYLQIRCNSDLSVVHLIHLFKKKDSSILLSSSNNLKIILMENKMIHMLSQLLPFRQDF